MKKLVMVAMVLVVACQKHDDSTTSTSTSTATASASTVATASAAPLATIEPMASALPTIAPSAAATGSSADDKRRAELAKQAEQMQLQMLQAFASSQPTENVLSGSTPDDFAALVADSGAGLRVGGSGGPLRPRHRGNGLADLGTRDH